VGDSAAVDSGLGVHHADLPTAELRPGTSVRFTFYWPGASRWEGVDFSVRVVGNEEEQRDAEPGYTGAEVVAAPAGGMT